MGLTASHTVAVMEFVIILFHPSTSVKTGNQIIIITILIIMIIIFIIIIINMIIVIATFIIMIMIMIRSRLVFNYQACVEIKPPS